MNKKAQATHEGELHIGNKSLSCAVLDDGTRVITATAVFQAFERPRKGKSSEGYRADHMPSFINANNLQPYINEELMGWTSPIEYQTISGGTRTGYNARILRALCKVYIDARRAGVLLASQIRQAEVAESLLYALSDIGITALVDEATGYQFDRERDELQKLLQAYVSDGLLKWQKTFPDMYYQQIFRLNGWDFTLHNIRKRPGIVGRWTNALIYEQLPEGVLEELKRKTPISERGHRTARYHQSLTLDTGHPHLTAQINRVLGLMKSADDWVEFMHLFNKMVKRDKSAKQIEVSVLKSADSKTISDNDRFCGDLFDDL